METIAHRPLRRIAAAACLAWERSPICVSANAGEEVTQPIEIAAASWLKSNGVCVLGRSGSALASALPSLLRDEPNPLLRWRGRFHELPNGVENDPKL